VRIDVLTREYPPEVYGGAGVHAAELVRALRGLTDVDVQVRCFGAARGEPDTTAYGQLVELAGANPAVQTMGVDLPMAQDCAGADLVHTHTWYANLAGHLA
jgi:starch synthase